MHFGEGGWKRWQEEGIVLPSRGEVKGRPAVGNQGGKLLLCHFGIGNLQLGETFFSILPAGGSWQSGYVFRS